jgi:hypothetical protein
MLIYPDKKKSSSVAETSKSQQQVLRVLALIIVFISVFGFFLKILFF